MKREELIKKKKKKAPRFIKFVFILVFIIAFVSLILYSIDNPDFLSSIKNKFMSFYSSSEDSKLASESNSSSSEGSTSISEESSQSASSESSNDVSTTGNDESVNGNNLTAVNKSFWQKIIDFFKSKIAEQSNKSFPDKININFYFCNLGEDSKFISEKRTINAGDPKTAVTNAMKELLKGPSKTYHFPVIPSGTKLLGVEIYENLAKINLSQEFLNNSLTSGILDEYVVYTIVNTVTEIPGVEGVIFLIDGKIIKLYGGVDLSIPAIRNEKYLDESSQ
jgi:spore germination protein GerM